MVPFPLEEEQNLEKTKHKLPLNRNQLIDLQFKSNDWFP